MSSFTRFDAPMLAQHYDKASALIGADNCRVAEKALFEAPECSI